MKRIIITGEGGWIGNAVEQRLNELPSAYEVRCVSLFGNGWKSDDWSDVDSIIHLAGIPGDGASEAEYAETNVLLTERVAQKCISDGVPHLVFMSSAHVYGSGAGDASPIDVSTEPSPSTLYGKSKLAAEECLRALENNTFSVCVIRPPLVYGPGCKRGNFPRIVKISATIPVFPYLHNARSMLYLGSLVELIRLAIDSKADGTFLPQDPEWICTAEFVQELGQAQGHCIHLSPMLGRVLLPFVPRVRLLGKLFGNFRYELTASECGLDYRVSSTSEAVWKSVGRFSQ